MPEKVRIRAMQLFWLLMVARLAPAICFTPALTATPAPQCWRSNLPATLAGLVLALLFVALARRFPDETLIQYAPRVLGRWPGRLVGLLYIWFFMHVAALDTRVFTEIFITTLLPGTPPVAMAALAVAVVAYAVHGGLETLARMGEVLMPASVVTLLVLLAFAAKDLSPSRLLPLTEGGLKPVLLSALTPTVLLGEAVAVTMLYPFLRQRRQAGRAVAGAVLAAGLLALLTSIAVVALVGDEPSHRLTFPILTVVSYIRVGEVLERLESLVIPVWVGTWTLKTGLFLFLSAVGLAQWLGLRDYRALVLPLGAFILVLSLVQSQNLPQFVSFFQPDVYFPYAGLFTILMPAILLALSGRASPQPRRQPGRRRW